MACDMCGTEGRLFLCEIEGTRLKVCQNCSRYGKVIHSVKPEPVNEAKKEHKKQEHKPAGNVEKPEPVLIISPDFAKLIKAARERMGLKQEEAAKRLNEKASLLHHIETGKHKPDMELARKLEKFFNIRLIQELSEEKGWKGRASSDQMTVGDLLKP